ncbi:hypothetical protein BDQ17DRAFT_1336066 [Cyathus striatus]|nr:hypothetical protein BDQ17DRAFT_1336066 [Cyathus striatus]
MTERAAYLRELVFLVAQSHLYWEEITQWNLNHPGEAFTLQAGHDFSFRQIHIKEAHAPNITHVDVVESLIQNGILPLWIDYVYPYGLHYLEGHYKGTLFLHSLLDTVDTKQLFHLDEFGEPPTIPEWAGWWTPEQGDLDRIHTLQWIAASQAGNKSGRPEDSAIYAHFVKKEHNEKTKQWIVTCNYCSKDIIHYDNQCLIHLAWECKKIGYEEWQVANLQLIDCGGGAIVEISDDEIDGEGSSSAVRMTSGPPKKKQKTAPGKVVVITRMGNFINRAITAEEQVVANTCLLSHMFQLTIRELIDSETQLTLIQSGIKY